ncbi:hypothetical protein QL285_051408 [Trifolium repens]|nr:hypothetical protein QL285_051408 [Trifolium repens]
MLPSRHQSSVLRHLALFQTWTSSPSKSCNCFMEIEHTSKNNIESLVGLNEDKSGIISNQFSHSDSMLLERKHGELIIRKKKVNRRKD